jgi:RNase adaptor protein for sRNA GlmZ degradation
MYDYARQNNLIKEEGEYLSRIGDRQDLHINLTQMSDAELVHTVKEHLISLKDELKIPLSDESVIKTGYSRISKR